MPSSDVRDYIQSAVPRGASLLDDRFAGWQHRIDLTRLDLQDSKRCILGQLYGDYHKALRRLFGGGYQSYAMHGSANGFSYPIHLIESFYQQDHSEMFDLLFSLWFQETIKRRKPRVH